MQSTPRKDRIFDFNNGAPDDNFGIHFHPGTMPWDHGMRLFIYHGHSSVTSLDVRESFPNLNWTHVAVVMTGNGVLSGEPPPGGPLAVRYAGLPPGGPRAA